MHRVPWRTARCGGDSARRSAETQQVAATGKQSCTAPPTSKCTAPGSLDTRLSLSGGAEHRLVPGGSGVVGAGVAVLFNQPFGVVSGDESADGIAHIIDGLVDARVHDLFLEGTEEAFDDPVRLRIADERVARRETPKADLLLEVLGHEIAAVSVAERQAAGDAGAEAEVSELVADRHADGLG